jgi:hypothetical protein
MTYVLLQYGWARRSPTMPTLLTCLLVCDVGLWGQLCWRNSPSILTGCASKLAQLAAQVKTQPKVRLAKLGKLAKKFPQPCQLRKQACTACCASETRLSRRNIIRGNWAMVIVVNTLLPVASATLMLQKQMQLLTCWLVFTSNNSTSLGFAAQLQAAGQARHSSWLGRNVKSVVLVGYCCLTLDC